MMLQNICSNPAFISEVTKQGELACLTSIMCTNVESGAL